MITMTCRILVMSPGPDGRGCPPVTGRPGEAKQPGAAFVLVWDDEEQELAAKATPVSTAPAMRPRPTVLGISSLLRVRKPWSLTMVARTARPVSAPDHCSGRTLSAVT